jgi:hypothetical protein
MAVAHGLPCCLCPPWLTYCHLLLPGLQFLEGRRPRQDVTTSPTLVHAHKATAQPLELHAREDVAATDRVPPVTKGATAVPLTETGAGGGCWCDAEQLCVLVAIAP